jgi:hypothetical protein
MEKLKAKLAIDTSRAKALDTKCTEAQTKLDRAIEARDRHKLEGDLENVQAEEKLQDAVNSATSALSGFAGPMASLAKSIADIEKKIDDEQNDANKKRAAETVIARKNIIEKKTGPWLSQTRDYASAFAEVGSSDFESAQIAGYLRNCASEIEAAAEMAIGNLQSFAAGILSGQHPIPRAPGAAPVKAPAPVLVTTERLFLTQHVGWYDENGKQHVAASMNDADLPLALVAKARQLGAAHDLDSDQRRKHGGSKTSAPPAWQHCKILNENPKAKTDVEPVISSHFSPHPNPRQPYSFRQPAQPQAGTAMRSLPPQKK